MDPAAQLQRFLARYQPAIAGLARDAIARLRRRLPGATVLVYDNYNALVVGFGPSERAGEAPLSMALYPRWVRLFFLQGASLADPDGVLEGSGARVRSVRLEAAADLDRPPLSTLIARAVGPVPMPVSGGRVVVRAVAPRRRARTPAATPKPKPRKRATARPVRRAARG